MKFRKIILLIALMFLTVTGLFLTQYSIINYLNKLSTEKFEESAEKAIRRTVRFLEEKETLYYASEIVAQQNPDVKDELDSLRDRTHFVSQLDRVDYGHGDSSADREIEIIREKALESQEKLQDIVTQTIYSWKNDAKNADLTKRLDFDEMNLVLQTHMEICGIDEPYEFFIYDQVGRLIYYTPLVQSERRLRKPSFVFEVPLFPADLNAGNACIKVVFPTMKPSMRDGMKYFVPSLILVLFVMIIFVYTTVTISRQRTIGQMKVDFINNMTHEFKTPLASISLAAQMLQDTNVSNSPGRIMSMSKIISDESRRLQLLIEKILQVSVYDKQSMKINLTDLSVNQQIEDVCRSFEINISHVGGQLKCELQAQHDIALLDKLHFSNIIYNLLDNAIKYRSADRPLIVYVRTSCNQEGFIQITIEDNGIGISKSDLKHIFDQFFRVHTGDLHDVKGYGIGLAYVKLMVEAHHGTINVVSTPDVGTTFTIELPTL